MQAEKDEGQSARRQFSGGRHGEEGAPFNVMQMVQNERLNEEISKLLEEHKSSNY